MSEHASDEQLSLLVDGELSLAARTAVVSHLSSCPGCAERHDALVDVVAPLRLAPPVVWQESSTACVLERTHAPRPGHDLALPIAGVIAVVAIVLVALRSEVVEAGLSSAYATAEAIGALLPTALATQPTGTLMALVAVALIAPVLSLRLARR